MEYNSYIDILNLLFNKYCLSNISSSNKDKLITTIESINNNVFYDTYNTLDDLGILRYYLGFVEENSEQSIIFLNKVFDLLGFNFYTSDNKNVRIEEYIYMIFTHILIEQEKENLQLSSILMEIYNILKETIGKEKVIPVKPYRYMNINELCTFMRRIIDDISKKMEYETMSELPNDIRYDFKTIEDNTSDMSQKESGIIKCNYIINKINNLLQDTNIHKSKIIIILLTLLYRYVEHGAWLEIVKKCKQYI